MVEKTDAGSTAGVGSAAGVGSIDAVSVETDEVAVTEKRPHLRNKDVIATIVETASYRLVSEGYMQIDDLKDGCRDLLVVLGSLLLGTEEDILAVRKVAANPAAASLKVQPWRVSNLGHTSLSSKRENVSAKVLVDELMDASAADKTWYWLGQIVGECLVETFRWRDCFTLRNILKDIGWWATDAISEHTAAWVLRSGVRFPAVENQEPTPGDDPGPRYA